MKFKKSAIAILIISAAALEAILVWPKAVYVAFGLINLLVVLEIWRLAGFGRIKRGWLNLIILPLIFITGTIAYVSLLPESIFLNKILSQCIFAATLYFLYVYFRQLHVFLREPERPNHLLSFSSGATFLALFLAVSAIFGLQLFLNLSYWILMLIIILIALGLTYQFLWLNSLQRGENWLFTGVIVFVMAQIFWALYFLPFDYNVLGLLLVLAYYVLISVLKFYLTDSLHRRQLKPLFIFVAVILFLIFLTVRWR